MDTGLTGKPERVFHVRFTERIYRLHLGGVTNHAPRGGGVYELVEFPPDAEDGTVLYVGQVPQGGSIAGELQAVIEGRGGLPEDKLRAVHARMANLYFDAVLTADCESDLDWRDLAWALVRSKQPLLNDPKTQPNSGRFGAIRYEDLAD